MKAAFIAIDGIDGCGKSTQSRILAENLQIAGHDVVQTREPGGTEVGLELRKLLVSTRYDLDSRSELMLYCVDRLEHQRKVVLPAIADGKTVLSDRFLPSTYAYQIFGRGMDRVFLDSLVPLTVTRMPDITVILDIDPETALSRAMQRLKRDGKEDDEGKFEQLGIDFFARVREGFLWYAKTHPNVVVINGKGGMKQISSEILAAVEHLL